MPIDTRKGRGFDHSPHRAQGADRRAGGSEDRHREQGKQARAPCRGDRIRSPTERERQGADHLIDQRSGGGARRPPSSARRARPRSPSPIPNAAPAAAPMADQAPP